MRKSLSERQEEMREAFDRSFERPGLADGGRADDYLMLRVGSDPFAVRVPEVAHVARATDLCRIPSRQPLFVGVTSFRGVSVPVFRLSGFLGYAAPDRPPTWILLADSRDLVGLAVDGIEGCARIRQEAGSIEDAAGSSAFVKHAVRAGGILRPIVDLQALAASIKGRPSS